MAIMARWRMPPESSWGKRRATLAGRPTSASTSRVRARASEREHCLWKTMGSAIWSPIRCTGLRAFMAPWKTMAACVQRTARALPPRRRARRCRRGSTLTVDRGERGQQPHGRQDQGGLAAARLAQHPHPFARLDRQIDAAHGVSRAAVGGVEPHMQTGDIEDAHRSSSAVAARRRNERGDTWACPRRGFIASSSPWPTRKQASTTTAMQIPGGTMAHQAPDETAECRMAL